MPSAAQDLGRHLDFGPATVLGSPVQSRCCCSPEPSKMSDSDHSWCGGEEAETSYQSDSSTVVWWVSARDGGSIKSQTGEF